MIIVGRAGLQPSMINWQGSPVDVWAVVLDEAVAEGRIDALLAVALAERPELADAVQNYQENRAS